VDYKTEDIGGIRVCVSDAHTFGTDAFLLSHFAKPKKHDTACDLGTGCGIIPLLWLRGNLVKSITAVDIQEQAIGQLSETVRLNALEGRLAPVLADLRELKGVLPFGVYDLVTLNPPYNAGGSGILSCGESDKIARHETLCTLDDSCAAASNLLRFGGRFCMCHLPERLADVLEAMRAHKLEPKRMRFVQKDKTSAPWLVLIEGKRGAKPFLKAEPALLLYEDKETSPEMRQIYKNFGHIIAKE